MGKVFNFSKVEKKSIVENRYIVIDSSMIWENTIVSLTYDTIEETLLVHFIVEQENKDFLNPKPYFNIPLTEIKTIDILEFIPALEDYYQHEDYFYRSCLKSLNRYTNPSKSVVTKEDLLDIAEGKKYVFKTPTFRFRFNPQIKIENEDKCYTLYSYIPEDILKYRVVYTDLIEEIEKCKNHFQQLMSTRSKTIWEDIKKKSSSFKDLENCELNTLFDIFEKGILSFENSKYEPRVEHIVPGF